MAGAGRVRAEGVGEGIYERSVGNEIDLLASHGQTMANGLSKHISILDAVNVLENCTRWPTSI
jgi:hypothetical protein